jgi:hypothetical protein
LPNVPQVFVEDMDIDGGDVEHAVSGSCVRRAFFVEVTLSVAACGGNRVSLW